MAKKMIQEEVKQEEQKPAVAPTTPQTLTQPTAPTATNPFTATGRGTMMNSPSPMISNTIPTQPTAPNPSAISKEEAQNLLTPNAPTQPENRDYTLAKVRVNPDGTYTYSVGGQDFQLTAAELAGKNSQRTGVVNEKVKQLQAMEDYQRLRLKIQKGLDEKKDIATITADLKKEEAQRRGVNPALLESIGQNPNQAQAAINQNVESGLASQEYMTNVQEGIQVNPIDSTTGEKAVGIAASSPAIAAGIGTGAALGAKGGAMIGSAFSPAGTAVGAGAGAVAGGLIGGASALLTKVALDKKQDVKTATSNFKASKTNLGVILNQVNQGLISPEEAVIAWDNEVQSLNYSYSILKGATDSDLDRFLSGGMDEMVKMEAFNRTLPFMNRQLANALVTPDPTKITDFSEPEVTTNE